MVHITTLKITRIRCGSPVHIAHPLEDIRGVVHVDIANPKPKSSSNIFPRLLMRV